MEGLLSGMISMLLFTPENQIVLTCTNDTLRIYTNEPRLATLKISYAFNITNNIGWSFCYCDLNGLDDWLDIIGLYLVSFPTWRWWHQQKKELFQNQLHFGERLQKQNFTFLRTSCNNNLHHKMWQFSSNISGFIKNKLALHLWAP